MRKQVGTLAVKAAKSVHYSNVGTVEFLLDLKDNQFYFMEINPRIQVEHGVTEEVTGIDIVRTQIRIAAGEPLDITQADVHFQGHAIECRINAEDPTANFRPCPGKVEFLHFPGGPGVRVDSALYNGCTLSPYYDSLAAKVMVHAPTRLEAIRRMRRSLEELVIEGYPTNSALAHLIMHDGEFVRGQYDTSFLDRNLPRLLELAHTIEEMKTICTCGRKAICNCRKVNGRFVFEGEQVAIDLENDVQYVSMCPQCYFKAKRAFYAEKAALRVE